MTLVTSYTKAKIDALLADLSAWSTATFAGITEPLAVAAQNDVDALTATVSANDSAAVHNTGNETVAGEKTFSDTIKGVSTDNHFGAGAAGGTGSYVDLGSLGTSDAWVDARGSYTDIDLKLRAKGAGKINAQSRVYLPNGLQVLQTNVGTSTYTATLNDEIIAVGTTCTVTLPNSAGGLYAGKKYVITNTGSGTVTLAGATFVGTTTTLPAGNSVVLWSDGTNYYCDTPYQRIVCTSSTKPTGNLYAGLEIFETDTFRVRIYDGSGWKTYADTSAGTWTPTLTNVSSGAASGKYKYINQYLMHIQIAITAGTWTTAGTIVTATLPSGITADSFMTQPIAWNFNANISPTGYVSGGDNKVSLSYINPQTAGNIAAGTSVANARIEGVISIA